MYIPFLLSARYMFNHLASCNWVLPLYGTSRSTRECWVPRQSSCTSAAFQFRHLPNIPNDVSSPLYDECHYDIRILYELTGYWMHTVYPLRCVHLVATIGRALLSCSCNGRAWHWNTKQRISSPVSPEFPYFRFPIRLVNRVEYLKSVAKTWTLRAEKQPWLLAFPAVLYDTRWKVKLSL
jgi:hypothetical protein